MENLEDLLVKTRKNFKLAESQYLESDEKTDQSIKKLRKMNYDNATNILHLVENMMGKEETVQKKNPNISEESSRHVTSTSQNNSKEKLILKSNNDEPSQNSKNDKIELQLPDYDKIQKDSSETSDTQLTVSTSDVLREAAKQIFVSGKTKKESKENTTSKPAKSAKSSKHSTDNKSKSTMTREQYRKLHSKD